MKKFIMWVVSTFFIVTNFEWFLNLLFEIYESLYRVFESYPLDYKILAVGALVIYFSIIIPQIRG